MAHESYLEREAHKEAVQGQYEDQIDICKGMDVPAAALDTVDIIINPQRFKTLYCSPPHGDTTGTCWEWLKQGKKTEERIQVNRRALIAGSSLAEEHFRYNPESTVLHLPVEWPRKHNAGSVCGYIKMENAQMAYIRSNEIKSLLVPWLSRLLILLQMGDKKNNDAESGALPATLAQRRTLTRATLMDPAKEYTLHIEPPETLLDKIHLYNAMLQLGLPKFVQQPLVDALVLQMYQKPLQHCHLDVLEITIGRFHSRGMAVLDPVICHFIGTYAFRSLQDRETPGDKADRAEETPEPADDLPSCRPAHVAPDGQTDFAKTGRQLLSFTNYNARRIAFPRDTFLLPPALPVLGHSIQNWSGVRRTGSTAAAFTGFPLNIGEAFKYVRTSGTQALSNDNVVREQTNRLAHQPYYHTEKPGRASEQDAGPSGVASSPPLLLSPARAKSSDAPPIIVAPTSKPPKAKPPKGKRPAAAPPETSRELRPKRVRK